MFAQMVLWLAELPHLPLTPDVIVQAVNFAPAPL
jgi:hypothetical protein